MAVVLVTGAGSGIGQHLAAVLHQCGDTVVACDINAEALPPGGDRMAPVAFDVTDPGGWDTAIATCESHGGIDILLNVAGFLKPGWHHELSPEDVALQLDVNVKGVILGTQAASRVMRERGKGHIVTIASTAALAPIAGLSVYSASKYAVRAFSLAVAQELRGTGVAVTVLCPDAVQTPMLDAQKGEESAALTFSGPRILTVDDIAQCIVEGVLPKRPLEVWLPRSRGYLARLADLFPSLQARIEPLLRAKGQRTQATMRTR